MAGHEGPYSPASTFVNLSTKSCLAPHFGQINGAFLDQITSTTSFKANIAFRDDLTPFKQPGWLEAVSHIFEVALAVLALT